MKQFAAVLLTVLVLSSVVHAGGKTEPKWRTFDAGLAEAKKTNKKIMLDIYTDWCKWCKKLDAEVYSEEKVADYLSKKYVVIKVNGESGEKQTYKGKTYSGIELAQAFGVTGYPTILFLDSKAEPIDRLGGFVDAEKFLPIIKFFGDDAYKKMTWEEYTKKTASTGKK